MMRFSLLMAMATGASILTLAGCADYQDAGRQPPAGGAQIQPASLPLVRTIDERFQSFQLGFSHLTGGDTWVSYDKLPVGAARERENAGDMSSIREARAPTDLANPRFRKLVAALSPLYIRYGGTTTNSVYFQNDEQPKLQKAPEGFNTVLTRRRWREALDFARAVDAKIFTGLAVSHGTRDKAGVWTPEHARRWLDYTKSIGGEIYAIELFNEPNVQSHSEKLGNYRAPEFARDSAIFRETVRSVDPRIKLVGPSDVETGGGAMAEFPGTEDYLSANPRPIYDILSYHFYPAIAERCASAESPRGVKVENALSEEYLGRQDVPLLARKKLRDQFAPGAPIWNTETGGAACGGTRWQTAFLDTFRFIDTQARVAKLGMDAMFTHAILSGSNGVIDEKTFMPNADYWAALLWRKVVGTQVLDAGPNKPGLHLYAHCLRGTPGGVTLIAINLEGANASVPVSGPAEVYALTSPDLMSKTVLLNGKALALTAGDDLPAITPVKRDGRAVMVAGHSVNFITFPRAGNPSCTSAR